MFWPWRRGGPDGGGQGQLAGHGGGGGMATVPAVLQYPGQRREGGKT